jgi:chloride channel protein, CIC family
VTPGPSVDDVDRSTPIRLLALAAIAGVGIGLVGAAFRRLLDLTTVVRVDLAGWARAGASWRVPLVVAAGALAVAAARALVRLAPEAGGSGVQRVEAELRAQDAPPRLRVVPVKFVGGLLSLGAGMALGREAPPCTWELPLATRSLA